MRITLLLALFSLAAAPVAAQGIVVQVRCQGACPAGPHRQMTLDTVKAWATLERGHAMTHVNHVFRNDTEGTVDGALFFPLPAGAAIHEVSVFDAALPAHDRNALLQYNRWSGPDESRWIMEGLVRGQPDSGLRAYAGVPVVPVVHVAVASIPPRGIRHVRIAYTQPLRAEGGAITYRYPLSTGARAVPIGHLTLGVEVKTENGFRDLRSPSHAVDVQAGTEGGPCRPEAACGWTTVTTHRVKVVRLQEGPELRARDFELVYTPDDPAQPRSAASPPGRP
jgi:hypothetical protein